MAWYRIAVVDYPEKLRKTVFSGEQDSRIPHAVALEMGQPAEDLDEIEGVNVVYYFDLEKEIECGDFFFVSVSEALDWCDSALGLNPTAFNIFDPPIILSE